MSSTIFLVALLPVGAAWVTWLIAADTRRYLTRYDLQSWRERNYLKSLPNFLQAMHDGNFVSAWPSGRNAVAAVYFGYRVRPILRTRQGMNRRSFLYQHLNLHAQLEILRPHIRDAIMAAQLRVVMDRVLTMEDTTDRDRLLAFVDQVRSYRAAYEESLTSYDRQLVALMRAHRFVETLRMVHAVCQEHGFQLMPEFNELRKWEDLEGSELVQELPVLPRGQVLRRAMGLNRKPQAAQAPMEPGLG